MTAPENLLPPAQKPVKWGIIGCGAIAESAIIPAMKWSPMCEVVALASRALPVAVEKAGELGIPRAHGTYDALLADADVEAVYIGTPSGLHEEWAIKAAAAGKHVLCEKSLALNSAAARRMAEAAQAAGTRLMEAYMYRHHPQWDHVLGMIRAGRIGDVQSVRAGLSGQLLEDDNHRWSALIGGGALYDVTCYGLNAARFIFGREPESVVAMADRQTREGVDATSHAILDFGYGRMAVISGSLRANNHQFCEIEGTRGRIVMPHPFIPGWESVTVHVEEGMTMEDVRIAGANHFLHEIEHFCLCARDPRRPLAPAEDGLRQALLNEAVEQSWISGGKVEVPEP